MVNSGMAEHTASSQAARRAPGEAPSRRDQWLRWGWLLVLPMTLVGAPLAGSRPSYAAPLERVTAPLRCERAQFLAIDRDSYDQIIAGRPYGSSAPAISQVSGARERAELRCA